MSQHLKEQGEPRPFYSNEVELLYRFWLQFLKTVGDYTAQFYLLQDLSIREHDPDSDVILARYYDNDIRVLRSKSQQNLRTMEQCIRQIRQQQIRLGLDSFKVDDESINRFIDFFTLKECCAKARRGFYRRKIRSELKKKEAKPFSLNDLERAFKNSKSYRTALAKAPF